MEILRISLRGEFRAGLRLVLPQVTEADLEAFEALLARDCVVADDGAPHPDLVAWVERILNRGAPDALAVPVRPVPSKGPAGAEVAV